MIVAPDTRTVNIDVDDTLIMWDVNPIDKDVIRIPGINGEIGIFVKPHLKHIQMLKNFKGIGWYVVVWSQGGAAHAANVVRTLNLQDYVDLVISKPEVYFDDIAFDQQGIPRKYINEV